MQFFKTEKKSGLTLALVVGWLAAAPGGFAALQVGLQPEELFVNETGILIIQSDRELPQNAILPKVEGLTWFGNPQPSQETRIIKGRRSFRGVVRYPFRCSRLGRVRIAGVKVREGGKLTELPAVEFTVKERRFTTTDNRELTMDDVLYVRATFPSLPPDAAEGRHQVFVGESVPVRIEVFALDSLVPRFQQYPVLETDNAIVRDYSAVNDTSPQFDVGREARRIVDGLRYRIWTFTTMITSLGTGPVNVSGTISLGISLPGERRDFFSDFMPMARGGKIQTLNFKLPKLSAKAVPAPPTDAGQYLGLIGDWNVSFALPKPEGKVGEPLTLIMTVAGDGALNTLKVPELDLANFRVYDPEVSKDVVQGKATVTWAIIPLSVQADMIKLSVCSFDSRNQKYSTHAFQKTVSVAPGDRTGGDGNSVVFDPGSGAPLAQMPPPASDLLYIKNRPGSGVALPLYRNMGTKAVVAIVFGGIVAMLGGGVRLKRAGVVQDETAARRRAAMKKRGRVAKNILHGGAAESMRCAREEAVPLIADLWGCPPGTAAGELAELCEKENSDLAAMLRKLEKDGFAPESGSEQFDKDHFASILRRMPGVILATLTTLMFCVGGGPAQATDFSEGIAAYDSGDYNRAARIFESLGRADAEDPVLLYNRGNCAFEMGQPAEAIALYERAHLLAPRDSDISENLNFVRDKLGLAPTGRAQTPGELLLRIRDAMRPDEWALMASLFLSSALIWLGIAWLKRYKWPPVCVLLLLASLCCGLVAHQQTRTSYRLHSKAIIGSRQATAYRHPSADARKTEFSPAFGDCVEIVERRNGWQLIRQAEAEGWIHSEHLLSVW